MSKAAELYPQDGSIACAAPGGAAEVRERIARRIETIEEQAPLRGRGPRCGGAWRARDLWLVPISATCPTPATWAGSLPPRAHA